MVKDRIAISAAFFQTSELVINLCMDPSYYEHHQTEAFNSVAGLPMHALVEKIPDDGLNSQLGLARGCLQVDFN